VAFVGSDQESFAWPKAGAEPLTALSAARALLQLVGGPNIKATDIDTLPVPDAVAPAEAWIQVALEGLELNPEDMPQTWPLFEAARASAELTDSPEDVVDYVSEAMRALQEPVATILPTVQMDTPLRGTELETLVAQLAHMESATVSHQGGRLSVGMMSMTGTTETPVVFDSTVAPDGQFLREIAVLADTSVVLNQASNARVVFLQISAVQDIADAEGSTSIKAQVAKHIVDSLLANAVAQSWPTAMRKSMGVQLLTGGFRRRLASSPTPAPTTTPTYYTLPEIVTFQINLWTAVALVLVLLSALCCMVNMDIQPDSLLYAKFQADVSSKFD